MTSASVLIKNLMSTPQSIDCKLSPKHIIRASLGPQGTKNAKGGAADQVDVGAIASLSDLQHAPEIQKLLNFVNPTTGLITPRIAISVVAGDHDVKGADVGAVIDASGMDSGSPRLVVAIAAGSAGNRDVIFYNANFPFAAQLIDAQIMVNTTHAGSTLTMRSATAGSGNALTQAMSMATAGRVRDAGTGETGGDGTIPSLAINSTLVARMTQGDAACTVILEFARLS